MPSQVTIGSNTYDIYSSVADVDSWANGSLTASDWEALVEDDKARVLVTVTRWIDSECWQGEKVDPAQSLDFPRVINGATVIDPIEQAAILLSILTAANPELPDTMTGNVSTVTTDGGTKSLKAGSVAIEYFRKLGFTTIGDGGVSSFPANVMNLIGQYLCDAVDGSGWGNAGATAYGTCEPARVGQRGRYNVTWPI